MEGIPLSPFCFSPPAEDRSKGERGEILRRRLFKGGRQHDIANVLQFSHFHDSFASKKTSGVSGVLASCSVIIVELNSCFHTWAPTFSQRGKNALYEAPQKLGLGEGSCLTI